jgi:hypothetical protein
MDDPHAWLHGELPNLVAEGLLTEAQAERIRARYPAEARRSALATIVPAVGALLVGAGTLVLFAERWAELDRGARTLLALAPIAVAAAYDAWARRVARASLHAEAAGAALLCGAGATLALLRTTWEIPIDDARSLALACAATLAVAWARGLTGALVAYPPLVLAFAASYGSERSGATTFLAAAMLAAAAPALRLRARSALAWRALAWSFGLAGLGVGVKAAFEADASPLVPLAAWTLGAHALARGVCEPAGEAARTVALLVRFALVPLLLALGFEGAWAHGEDLRRALHPSTLEEAAFTALALAPWGAAGFAWVRGAALDRAVVALGVLTFAGLAALHLGLSPVIPPLTAIALTIAIGADRLRAGVATGSASELNLGLSLVLGLVVVHVAGVAFDPLAKGLLFIGAGAAVLLVNRAVLRRGA